MKASWISVALSLVALTGLTGNSFGQDRQIGSGVKRVTPSISGLPLMKLVWTGDQLPKKLQSLQSTFKTGMKQSPVIDKKIKMIKPGVQTVGKTIKPLSH